MTTDKTAHPSSIDDYIRHGWSLVPIPPHTKGPHSQGWNIKHNALKSQEDLPDGYGVGLSHAYSGTMALDIDDWATATDLLAPHGINLYSLYEAHDSVAIASGKPGRGKLLYKMPFGMALPSKKIMHNGVVAYELRCATASGLTVQDVLPPSIHPETNRPYEWAGNGHWTRLPLIPQQLLDLWGEMIKDDKERIIPTGEDIDASWDEIRSAVSAISPDCARDQWVSVGMALHWAGSHTNQLDQALQLWAEWSAEAKTKYSGEKEILTQWYSFRSDKASTVKLGTLFHIAREYGWKRPEADISDLFKSIKIEHIGPSDLIGGGDEKVPEMDTSIWPDTLRKRSIEVSEGVGCDPLVPLFAGVAAVCGVVDARMRLELMPGFQVPPVLWLMTIGDPADKKSPGSKPMLSPLKNIEAEDRPRYSKEMLEWEGKEAAYSSAKKAFLEWSSSTDALLGASDAPTVPELQKQPVPLKITISDITSQKLVRCASERPRGLLCHLDEMNSWIRKLTDKTSGEDRSAWVVSYESDHYEMDRVGAGAIYCENLAVSIYGNIQPMVLKQNATSLSADGLLQRFIPGVLNPSKTRLGNPTSEHLTSSAAWENMLRMIYALPVQVYHLSDEAYSMFREFQAWYEGAKSDERKINKNVSYMTAFGKLEGLAGRLALLFHIMEEPFSQKVSAGIMKRVISLIKGYVIPAYKHVYCGIGSPMSDDSGKNIIEHVILHSNTVKHYTMTELKRCAQAWFSNAEPEWRIEEALEYAMGVMEKAGWVAKISTETNRRRMEWVVNPGLYEMFKDYCGSINKAMQRSQDYIYSHGTDF